MFLLEPAFTWLGVAVTWLELLAFALSLACVSLTVWEIHWGWPLAILASLLYGWLFWVNRLYGDASLQGFFAITSLWGWWQWLFGHRRVDHGDDAPLAVAQLGPQRFALTIAVWLAAWIPLGAFLHAFTNTDVPWFDAFPTAGSVIGTILLARKLIENWLVWMGVNAVSIALFAWKSLWLTAILYLLFFALAVAGFLRWRGALTHAGA